MEEQYLNFNLKVKNLFIALCRGVAGIPPVLRELDYTVIWIEHRFQNSKGDIVKPEMILSSNQLEHTMLLESKAGGNIEMEQYQRYKDVTKEDLIERAYISRNSVQKIDVTYVVPKSAVEKASNAFDELSIKNPLVSVSQDKVWLDKNEFSATKLNMQFRNGINVIYDEIPLHFIPFDNESPEWIVAEKIFPIIFKFLCDNLYIFTGEKILGEVVPMWRELGALEQREVRKLITKVLTSASKYEFKGFMRQKRDISRSTHIETWEIIKNPLRLVPSKHGRAWKQLQNLQSRFLERLRTGKGQPIQPNLFDYL